MVSNMFRVLNFPSYHSYMIKRKYDIIYEIRMQFDDISALITCKLSLHDSTATFHRTCWAKAEWLCHYYYPGTACYLRNEVLDSQNTIPRRPCKRPWASQFQSQIQCVLSLDTVILVVPCQWGLPAAAVAATCQWMLRHRRRGTNSRLGLWRSDLLQIQPPSSRSLKVVRRTPGRRASVTGKEDQNKWLAAASHEQALLASRWKNVPG